MRLTLALVAASALAGCASSTANAPAPQATAQAVPAPAPAPPAAPAAAPAAPPPGLHGAVTLERAARATEAALGVAARRGFTQARLQLHPAELGTVEVHLRHSAHGLTARVVAEAPEAVGALQQAAGELRRALEAQGVTVLDLDVGARGDERRAHQDPAAAGPGRRARRTAEDEDAPEALTAVGLTPTTRIALPQGALLDVIA